MHIAELVCMYTWSTPKAPTAIRVSHPDLGYCLALMQTQRHRLEVCADPCSGRVGGRQSREGLRQIAPANCICGAKKWSALWGSMVVVLTIGVFSSKSFWGPLWNRSPGTLVIPIVWLIPIAPVLFCSWPSQLFSLWMV